MKTFLVVAFGLACNVACAADGLSPKTFASSFGFSVDLDTGWVLLTPDRVTDSAAALTAATLGVPDMSQPELNEIVERIKTGQVEFYFDSVLSVPDLTNNVSVQLRDGTQDYGPASESEISALCASMPKELEALWGTPVDVRGCKVVSSNGKAGLAYTYVIAANNMFVMQYELPFGASQTALVVGGGRLDNDVMTRVVTAVHAIAKSVMAQTK